MRQLALGVLPKEVAVSGWVRDPKVTVRRLGDGVECSVDAVELVVGDTFDDLSESGPRIEWRPAANHTVHHTMKRPIHAGATS